METMRIQSINNNTNFGKIPVLKCKVKKADEEKACSATLYKMEPNNPSDAREIKYSKNARSIYYDFMIDGGKHESNRDYYLLKRNDNTEEVIACAETSRHYRPDNAEFSGHTTFIEEMSENPKYEKGGLPLLAHIIINANDNNDKCVSTSTYTNADDSLKEAKFTQIITGDWILPKEEYWNSITGAMQNSGINYIG